ncbi:MAG: universal stress protein [Capsulimonadales bacterium]|nr:universal stress protein [Capsulimonadales bacterium]
MFDILYATDGSSSALGAARFLTHLPHPDRVRLHLVTVCPEDRDPDDTEGTEVLEATHEALAGFAGEITRSILRAENGTAAVVEAIAQEAARLDSDLVVVGVGGRSALHRLFPGSVADGVVRHAPCPTLMAAPVVGEAFDRILLAFDGSPDALAAAHWLPALPLSAICDIRVVSVVLPNPLFTGGAGILLLASGTDVDRLVEEDRAHIVATQEEMIRLLRDRGIGCTFRTDTVENRNAGEALTELAREDGTDLIVIGSRGRSGWEEILLGSVSNYVLHHAPCSVLVVRSATKAEPGA